MRSTSMLMAGNQFNPIDSTALTKPGMEAEEARLPLESIYANLGTVDQRCLRSAFLAGKGSCWMIGTELVIDGGASTI